MALNLDTRQRAMLQEMGITVWQPGPQEAASALTAVADRPVPPVQRPQAAPVMQPPAPAMAAAAPARPGLPLPLSTVVAELRAKRILWPQMNADERG